MSGTVHSGDGMVERARSLAGDVVPMKEFAWALCSPTIGP